MKKRFAIGSAACSLAALLLECLPFGAVLNFMRPPTDPEGVAGHFRRTYSYFSLMPVGYAHVTPFFTACLTCVLVALGVFYLWKGKGRRGIFAVSGVAFVLSLSPLLLGLRYFSVVGGLITLSLGAAFVLALLNRTKGE